MPKVAVFKRGQTDTRKPSAAVTRCRFVGDDGNQLTVAGARALGVAQDTLSAADITAGERVTITLDGLEELEINASINANTYTKIASDSVGRGVAAVAGDAINAISLNQENAVAGDRIVVLLVKGVDAAAATSGASLAALETEVNNLKTLIEKLIAV